MVVTSACPGAGAAAERGPAGLTPGGPGSSWSMATERKPAGRPAIELAPAAERGERWWPVALAIIVVAGLHVALPARDRVQPAWVAPGVLLALLAAVAARGPGPTDPPKAPPGRTPTPLTP